MVFVSRGSALQTTIAMLFPRIWGIPCSQNMLQFLCWSLVVSRGGGVGGVRNYAENAGSTELDPGFGGQIAVALDRNNLMCRGINLSDSIHRLKIPRSLETQNELPQSWNTTN